MPFRNQPPPRFQPFILPVFAVFSIMLIALWVFAAFTALGGYHHVSTPSKLVIYGLSGIAFLDLLGVCVAVWLIESAIADVRLFFTAYIEQRRSQAAAQREDGP